jgi:hypothetical protein
MSRQKSQFFKTGLPMIAFCVFGTIGLSVLMEGKQNATSDSLRGKRLSRDEEKYMLDGFQNIDVNSELEKMAESGVWDDFEQVRIARPAVGSDAAAALAKIEEERRDKMRGLMAKDNTRVRK